MAISSFSSTIKQKVYQFWPTDTWPQALALRLAASVALADGVVSALEKDLLKRQIRVWPHLNEIEQARLAAYLNLLLIEPPKLVGLKKNLESLDKGAREDIADILALVAQADCAINPKEVSILEKIYRILGLEPQAVYSNLHIAAVEPVTVQRGEAVGEGYKLPPQAKDARLSPLSLNAERIALLQSDSERVSAILGTIWPDDIRRRRGTAFWR